MLTVDNKDLDPSPGEFLRLVPWQVASVVTRVLVGCTRDPQTTDDMFRVHLGPNAAQQQNRRNEYSPSQFE